MNWRGRLWQSFAGRGGSCRRYRLDESLGSELINFSGRARMQVPGALIVLSWLFGIAENAARLNRKPTMREITVKIIVLDYLRLY